jgi:hypothetical protein
VILQQHSPHQALLFLQSYSPHIQETPIVDGFLSAADFLEYGKPRRILHPFARAALTYTEIAPEFLFPSRISAGAHR